MAKRKPGLTVDRHKEIGEKLNRIQELITKLEVEFGNAYPRSGYRSGPYKELCRVGKHLRRARSYAEDNYARENPADWETSTYYGVPKQPY